MGRSTISFGPSFLAREERGRLGQSFFSYQPFEGGEPMMVVVRTVVGLTAIGCRFEFGGQRRGPFFPGEMTFFGKPNREREGLGLPRFGKYGPANIARQLRQGGEFLGARGIRLVQGDHPKD